MHECLARDRTLISLEFFPPRDAVRFNEELQQLCLLGPDWVSMTCGAGGGNRDLTLNAAADLRRQGLTVTAHLTCQNAGRDQMRAQLDACGEAGINSIMALRGDKPWEGAGDFNYAADLVDFIHTDYPDFTVGVAGYPEGHPATVNRLTEMEHLKRKVDAGADFIVTQLCFDNRLIYDFIARCRLAGIDIPVIAGIMPVTSRANLQRMAELSGRCNYPAALLKALSRTDSPEQFKQVGIHWAAEQVRDLLNRNLAGIHLYTLNQAEAVLMIFEKLGMG